LRFTRIPSQNDGKSFEPYQIAGWLGRTGRRSWQGRNRQFLHRNNTTDITFASVVARNSGAGRPGGPRSEGRSLWSCWRSPCFSACTWCGPGWSCALN